MIVLLFATWRIVDLIISILTPRLIPYLGFFPYREILQELNVPSFITSLANFDGVHYLLISQEGYHQYEQVFFPLYPLLINVVSRLSINSLIVGLLISNIGFLIGIYFFRKTLQLKIFRVSSLWPIIFLITFPTSFYFGAVYTEGLFFLLFILSIYLFATKKYLTSVPVSFLAAITRLNGLFLSLIFLIVIFLQKHKLKNGLYLAIAAPIAGFLTYCGFLYLTTGDPLSFANSQKVFAGRTVSSFISFPQVEYRYLKIFVTANHDFRYFVAIIEFLVFNGTLLILVLDAYKIIKQKLYYLYPYRAALSVFSFINLLLPTLTGTFASTPRYALFSFSMFFYLSEIKSTTIKIVLAVIFAILHIVLLGFFIQGYFVS